MNIKDKFVSTTNEKTVIIAGAITIICLLFASLFKNEGSYGWISHLLFAAGFIPYVWMAIYYGMTFFSSKNGQGEKLYYFAANAMMTIIYIALIYQFLGLYHGGVLIYPDRFDAIYFSVVTWTTLGYGDFTPSDPSKYWAITEALMGYVYMGLFVGKLIFIGQIKANQKD